MVKFKRMAGIDGAPPIAPLAAVYGVDGDAGGYLATNGRPWLSIEPISIFAPGRWFRMRYRLGLYDRPLRPLVSYRQGSEEIGWHLLPGPVLGRAEWFGLVPTEATAVWISPVSEPGRFCFTIEEIEPLSSCALLRMGLAGNRGRLFSAAGTWLLGWRKEAQENFRWSLQGTPLTAWPAYRDRLSVAARLDEFESPRCDWARAPTARLLVFLDTEAAAAQIDETIAALRDQLYSRWTLTILGTSDDAAINGRINSWLTRDSRLAVRGEPMDLEGDDADFIAFVEFGDRLAPHALACFIEASHRTPDALVLYCDEETAAAQGQAPIFKPDWSPHLQAGRPYVGRLMLTRLGHARRRIRLGNAIGETGFVESVLQGLGRRDVRHIRRFLIQTRRRRRAEQAVTAAADPRPARAQDARVTIVMVTRDNADFLRRTISGILEKTRFAQLDLIIVDNDSTEARALSLLQSAAKDERVTLLRAPERFNYSALNNLGAAKARGDVLVFLNNDMDIIEPEWLRELAERAIDPQVGAVGCKLLYPDGRIQHAGVVLGIGEGTGHFDAGRRDGEPGWLGRNLIPHETSAVTGACLAVERAKFAAAGGFDAHLPVEYNDIDLCLRLEELGFTTLWTPFARLVHFESASRGKATFRRLDTHAAERAYFRQRWTSRLRDDPFFHPGLSLVSLTAALA
ncbi:MAG TPA: glycosyltransferase family 2 protein [Methylocella sp.]|jgi:GT2 family glycosyltransferase